VYDLSKRIAIRLSFFMIMIEIKHLRIRIALFCEVISLIPVGYTVQRSICYGFIRTYAGFSRFSQYDIMRIKLYDESLNRRVLHG